VIPRASITAWRKAAPWGENTQIEQDLVLSRALVELFGRPVFAKNAVFRGGTALHKLFFDPPGRYSEDIDLVQRTAGPVGPLVAEIRSALDPWLGKPKWKAGQGRFTLHYRFDTTFTPVVKMRLKVEINTREHFVVHGFTSRRIAVDNPWFSGEADVVTYTLPELLGTKLRALYQRKKGRDLFDLALALEHTDFDPALLIEAFEQYMAFGGTPVTRAQFEANMAAKISDPPFLNDVPSLLRTGLAYEPTEAWSRVHATLVTRLPGKPWKGDTDAS
jgi:predicted nucleotidyltransferase component of viral defense system